MTADAAPLAVGAEGGDPGSGSSVWMRRLTEYGIIWITLGLFVFLSISSRSFLTGANLRNIVDQQSLIVIGGAAMTLTLISGNFDISISSIYINATILTALLYNATESAFVAILAGVAMGAVFGFVNGWIVAKLGINSFIATLATSFVFFGIAFLVSDRSIIRVTDRDFSQIARGRDFILTNASWVAVAVVLIFWFVLERTTFGRHLFAVGGNAEAATLAGVRVPRILIATFVLTGVAAGLAGALLASKTLSAQPSDDFSYVFAVLTAVIIGGTSIAGGEGAVWRTVAGAFFIALLTNGFNIHQIDPIIQRLVQGAVILLAVAADNWTRSRQ
jgi:ribose transport system permease protein